MEKGKGGREGERGREKEGTKRCSLPMLETNARIVAQTGDKLQSRCPGHCI